MNYKNKKVAVALSGGVDSAVTALLLKNQGCEVLGITGLMVEDRDTPAFIAGAKKVADAIGIEHFVLDLTCDFKNEVIEYFNNSYKKAQTPNPCGVCNKKIKWGRIFDYAINELGCDYFATGHYADINCHNGVYRLERAACDNKDQLYFLFDLTQEQLAKTLFPLGKYSSKDEIRQIAAKNNLPNKSNKDSQGICFIKKPLSVKKYLLNTLKVTRGKFVNIKTGEVVGKHDGYFQYTIGQRRGIGVSDTYPLYVCDINPEENTVYVGYEQDTYSSELKANKVNWQQSEFKDKEFKALAKIRYNTEAKPCRVLPDKEGFRVLFDEPVFAIAKGQICVIYDEDNSFLICGGRIV
ncbi:MAG: tRNA 2-thiouridine(34) synthase MnmA [Candidatus Gastranaerophilales bacterium]|nr:tRNA 2-thiouridine(34) synthase MnmA [Candidatus Gastranaerophilales bacterium]